MSDLLSIGASGVRAYQTALGTASDNIANAASAGYVRRTADLSEVSAGGRNGATGLGVTVAGITRSADAFRAAAVRGAGADVTRSEGSIVWMERIDGALTGNALGNRLTSFFNSAVAVAADPSATAPRSVMLAAAEGVAQAFTGTAKALDAASAELDATAAEAASQLSGIASALAQVNGGLARAADGSSGQAQLIDRRDHLLEEMSALVDADVQFDTVGRVTVRGGNASGPVLVSGTTAAAVSFARNEEGAVAFAVSTADGPAVLSPSGGALAGIVDGASRIADARSAMGAMAADFVAGVNAVQAGGQDLSGKPGAALFTVGANGEVGVAMTDPGGIAASAGGGVRDNANLANLGALRTGGAFEARTTALVAGNGAAIAQRRSVADAQGAIHDGAVAARDAVSGVNLDQEAVDLMRFQQAYQASSRIIQVARETLQTLFDIR